MNQDQRRLFLIDYLLKEDMKLHTMMIPKDLQGQRDLLRCLMNIRMPKPIDDEFLIVQDEYLQQRIVERGITDACDLQPVASDNRLFIWQGDITTLKCDAIVNACNSQMLGCFFPMHSCIDNSIHTYAGVQLRLKMNEIMTKQGYEEPPGHAKITSGYNLPSKFILHTVGPLVQLKVVSEDENKLASCYRECLKLAVENGVKSIAFCCLSTGIYRFPQQKAAEIAIKTVKDFLLINTEIKQVIFNVFKDEDLEIYSSVLGI
ncbi:MAG: protein-ADP-ribose hydrolase [Traorella sp.]